MVHLSSQLLLCLTLLCVHTLSLSKVLQPIISLSLSTSCFLSFLHLSHTQHAQCRHNMDSQDHKKPVTSTGHEVHGVHHCHRCGWPFPNPHPSARHRRAHKRVCGKVEGYKIIQSDLAVSDDEHASDDDEHTPSPKVEKKKVKEPGSSGGVGEKSNKSEDDVFSDAVTEFSESGISPSLEERLEVIKGVDKSVEQKSVEGLVNASQLNVDESAETTEQLNAPTTSGQTCSPGALVNAINQSGSVIPINDTGPDTIFAGHSNRVQLDIMKSDSQKNADIQVGDEVGCVSLDSEEGKNSYPAVMAIERKDELCDKLDGSTHISSSTNNTAVEDNSELEGVKGPVAGKYDASITRAIGSEDVESSVFNVHAIPSTGSSDPVSIVSSTDEEVKLKTSLSGGEKDGNFDLSEGAKCTTTGNENMNQESKNKFSAEIVSAPDSDTSFALKEDQILRPLKKDANDYDVNCKLWEPENERGKGPTMEVQAVVDSAMHSVNSTELLSSGEVGGDARHVEGLSKPGASEFESRDDIFQRYHEGSDTGKVTKVLASGGSSGLDIGLIHEVGDIEGAKSLGVAGLADESSRSGDVALSERTPEHPISKDCGNLLSESEFLEGNSATDNSCIHDDAKSSESVDDTKVVIELKCEGNAVVLPESSDSLTLKGQEPSSGNQICLSETDAEKRHTTEDVSTAGIASGEELTCHDNAVTSEKFLASPLFIEPIPSPSDQVLHQNHTNGDGKSIDDSGNITGIDSKSLQDKGDDNLTKEERSVSAMDVLGGSGWRTDSLEGKWGSVSAVSSQSNMAAAETNSQSSEKSESNLQNAKTTNGESHRNKSDDFEPPSFMTLVQSGGEDDQVATASEIETVQNNQQIKSEALKAGWFPSLTNVVNDSEGRKKNEEIIAKVTNWSPGKQHHSPLKNLLNEAKSPNTKQVPTADQKDETATKDNGASLTTVSSVLESEAPKDPIAHKEEWNSPARYPTEIKKEKKKGKPYWVPFVCCSSVNRDL